MIRVITGIKLWEVSFVRDPLDPNCIVLGIAGTVESSEEE